MHGDAFAMASELRSSRHACHASSRRGMPLIRLRHGAGEQPRPSRSAAMKSARAHRPPGSDREPRRRASSCGPLSDQTRGLRPNTLRQETCIRVAAQILGGSPRDAVCAASRASGRCKPRRTRLQARLGRAAGATTAPDYPCLSEAATILTPMLPSFVTTIGHHGSRTGSAAEPTAPAREPNSSTPEAAASAPRLL
jgi:hypothetical protein